MLIEKQDYMRKFKRRRCKPKKYTEERIDNFVKQADTFGGHGTFDVMLDLIEQEPTVNCQQSRVISVSLWD